MRHSEINGSTSSGWTLRATTPLIAVCCRGFAPSLTVSSRSCGGGAAGAQTDLLTLAVAESLIGAPPFESVERLPLESSDASGARAFAVVATIGNDSNPTPNTRI
eukprot:4461710-Prymnesium_polylepis.1